MWLKSCKVLIYVLLFMSSTKILVTSKMATFVGDVTGLQRRHHSQNIPHLVKKIKGFPLKVKSFRNTATYQKLWERVAFLPLPCTTWGYEFACTSVQKGRTLRKLINCFDSLKIKNILYLLVLLKISNSLDAF